MNPGGAAGNCDLQVKWQDAIYPYIKNGRGNVGYNGLGAGDYDEGLFRSPTGAKQAGGSYAVHQDVFMDAPTVPWTDATPTPTRPTRRTIEPSRPPSSTTSRTRS